MEVMPTTTESNTADSSELVESSKEMQISITNNDDEQSVKSDPQATMDIDELNTNTSISTEDKEADMSIPETQNEDKEEADIPIPETQNEDKEEADMPIPETQNKDKEGADMPISETQNEDKGGAEDKEEARDKEEEEEETKDKESSNVARENETAIENITAVGNDTANTNEMEVEESTKSDTEQDQKNVDEVESSSNEINKDSVTDVAEKVNEDTDETVTKTIDKQAIIEEMQSENEVSNETSRRSSPIEDKQDQEPEPDAEAEVNETLSETDDQEMQQEKPVFVHVSTKDDGDGEGEDKTLNTDVDMANEAGAEDPIGLDCGKDLIDYESAIDKVAALTDETITSDKSDELNAGKDADEELCIIPDTERVISQEEKDAATAAAAAEKEKEHVTEATDKSNEEIDSGKSDFAAVTESAAIATTPITTTSESAVDKTTAENTTRESTPDLKITKISENDATNCDCYQCNTNAKCLYKIDLPEKSINICTETCLESYKKSNKIPVEGTGNRIALKLKDIAKKMPASVMDVNKVFIRKCSECSLRIMSDDDKVLSWETMDFCNEDCLAKYQNRIGSHCANCKKIVLMSSLGKYCVRFGHDIRQFCCSICLEEFKKGLKVCSYCQKDISGGSEGFLAPVGDKGQFKDFCTQFCMEKYDQMSNKNSNKKSLPPDVAQCSVCNKTLPVVVLFEKLGKMHKFCGDPCFVAFKFVNDTNPIHCDMCKNYFDNDNTTEFSLFYDNFVKNFCCKTCQNIYIIANRKIVPCSWCKVKKYNFDMIKKSCNNGQVLMMCSLNCLSLFQVSVNAVSSKKMKCDFCSKISQAQYHLTMSDATIRNFCTYHCVMSFQNQFSKLPITLGSAGDKVVVANNSNTIKNPVPAGGPKRYQNRRSGVNDIANDVQMPVITNVQSLANTTNGPSNVGMRGSKGTHNQTQRAASPKPQIKQQVIIKAPPLPPMRNAATMCKPILHTKGISCRPHSSVKETQTDTVKEKTILVPVPIPIFVPAPMHMYSAPVPVPVPFPIPIPVPIFIPTTRNSANGIMKEIKKIQVKIPTDPFEAELLMMAEMVAGEKKVENTDSESDDDGGGGGDAGEPADGGFSPEGVDTSNTFGEDMLQMALKMATELDEPAVDLEGALTANTITATQNQNNSVSAEESVDDPQPMSQLIERHSMRGRKRPGRPPRTANQSKRGRRMSTQAEMPLMPAPQPPPPAEPIEKPDANMCLKYTFGVNAWKQWVTTKNAELEKSSSRRMKLFKNEILQLTADELNYSLCLFVKEVRKPNGTEYAPDTIYYLCLGIQQYLFENGRIDNIFTDAYYEKFTDCLDEVAKKFSVLYNDSHYIVTRVEEEHLWESKQLGAHSPHVLLSTLMFFNTKHFNLTTVDEHMQLSFSHIMKHWKRNPNQPGTAKIPGSRNVLLRFYPPQSTLDANSRKKKVYEQQENEDNPLRCPVKLYEFYLSKCPESVKTRNDVFYLLPERSCVPDSPVWYSTMALGREALEKMLHRVKMVKEINVALLTS